MHILEEDKRIFITTSNQEYKESNAKVSTPYFTSNQVLITHKSYQGSSYACFRVFVHQINFKKLYPSTPNHVKNIPRLTQTGIFPSIFYHHYTVVKTQSFKSFL